MMEVSFSFMANLSFHIQDVADRLVVKITLLFHDRTTICVPLYSNNYRSFTSALLFGLENAEAVMIFLRGARVEAKFIGFKIIFVENFEKVC